LERACGGRKYFRNSAWFQDSAQIVGTITVDPGTGRVVAAHVLSQGDPNLGSQPLLLDRVVQEYTTGIAFVTVLAPDTGPALHFIFGERNNPSSMQGYEGGPLGPRTDIVLDSGMTEVIDHGYTKPFKAAPGPT